MQESEEFKIPEIGREILNDPLKLQQQIASGKTFQEIVGYSDETMSKFYRAARRLFEKQRYEESSDAFIFLTTMNPFVHHYWLGLGMSEQLMDEHFGALIAYNMAILIDKENPIPHYHSATCHKALHDFENARICLDHVVSLAADRQEHSQIKQQAIAAKQSLSRKR